MRFLLDTHFLLWTAEESERLPRAVIEVLEDEENDFFFSAASIWAVAIKVGRRPNFDVTAGLLKRFLIENGFQELIVTGDHAMAVEGLPSFHKDPFDRMLIAQALHEGLVLLTVDKTVAKYGGLIRLV